MNCYQFLQIIPVTLINGERATKANGMLDTRLDFMFTATSIAKQLCLKGIGQEISLTNAEPSNNNNKKKKKKKKKKEKRKKKKTFQSKLVNLDISSKLNFEKFK